MAVELCCSKRLLQHKHCMPGVIKYAVFGCMVPKEVMYATSLLRHTMMYMVCTGHGRAASAKGAPSGRCERPCAGLAAIAPERFRRGVSQVAADAGAPRIAFRLGQSDLWGLLACTMSQAVAKRGGRRGQTSISLCCSTMARGGLQRCKQLTKWTINEEPWQAVVMYAAAGRSLSLN